MASQTRPEPMNASPYHSKVRVTLKFSDTQFPAGCMVTGKMELECKAEKGLGISVIMVELYAIEELTSRDHSATSTFLQSKRLFQGPGLPPSNSVHPFPAPGDPPLPSTYYHARRGNTTFLFQFPLPESSPSSIDFGSGLARLRYEVRASVGVFWKGEKKLVTDKKPIDVVEQFGEDFNRIDPDGVVVGESGKIWMQGKVIGGFIVAGQPACIELQVKNHSNKKNTGLSATLTRELFLPNQPSQKQPLQLSDTITSVSFRGPEYIIQPGVEGVANLVVDVPKQARGVKGGRRQGNGDKTSEPLFEVRCILSIKLALGIGSKDIRLDLPVTILHPSVVPDYAPPDMYAIPPGPMSAPLYDPASGMMYQLPISPAPYLDRPMSPYAYPVPPMSPPIVPYVDQGQVWLPQPSISPVPASIYPGSHYAHPVASPYMSLVAPFAPPPRPSSAGPAPSEPLHGLPSSMPSAVPPPPLIPFPTLGHTDGEREEGKGERASRISRHLRMSSRNRSASPPAHRYHMADAPPAHHDHTGTGAIALAAVPENIVSAQNAMSSPPTSPEMHTRKNLTLSPLPTGGDVVSPRPMLSPKVSFSKDPFEKVATLERLAAQEEEKKEVAVASSPSVPVAASSERRVNGEGQEKTLPKPPVPSGKEYVSTPRNRADSLFPPDLLEAGVDQTPPTPTLAAAVTSLKIPRGLRLGNASSGLDALEAKLLAEVGTRKPEKERVPDVRTVLPITIPRPNDVEPPVDSAISSLTLPTLDFDTDEKTLKRGKPSNRGGSDHGLEPEADFDLGDAYTTRARDSKETTTARGRESRDTKKAGGSGGARKKGDKHSSKQAADVDSGVKEKELQKLRKAAQGRITAWLGRIDPDAPPESATPPPETPPPVTLSPRRGRSPTPASRSPARSPAHSPAVSPARGPALTPEPPSTPLREKKSTEVVLKNIPASSPKSPPKDESQEAQAAPNPRSSGFLPISTLRARQQQVNPSVVKVGKKASPFDAYLLPKASPKLAVYPPRLSDSEVKYDVRSARGGKGGIVTSVATLWATGATQSQTGDKTPTLKPIPTKPPAVKPTPGAKPAKLVEQWKAKTGLDAITATSPTKPAPPIPKPKPNALKSPTSPTAPTAISPSASADGRLRAMRASPKTTTASPTVTSDPLDKSVADLTARRARMIKSSSVPAIVSSSTATPMLSSTASLARPSPVRVDRARLHTKLAPTIATIAEADTRTDTSGSTNATPVTGAKAPGSPPAKADYAFGQARLRELIKRYQGQLNSS